MKDSPVKSKNLQLVQILRGIAALLVVLLHAGENLKKTFGELFLFDFFAFGGAGVDIFFVLSGFIITYTSYHKITRPAGASSFARRRFIRIFPTYWAIATFFLILHFALPAYYQTKYPGGSLAFVATFLLFPGHVMVNGVSWTLTYEIFFYLIFLFAFFVRSRTVLAMLCVAYALVIIAAGVFAGSFSASPWLGLLFFPMNLEFLIGIFAAVVVLKIPEKMSIPLIIVGGFLFMVAGILTNTGFRITSTDFSRVILFGLPSLLLVLGVVRYESVKTVKPPKVLLQLGDGSYSLYLIHLPVIAACCKMLLWLNINSVAALHLAMLTLIVIVCGVSVLFFMLFERPIISRLNSLRRIRVANEI